MLFGRPVAEKWCLRGPAQRPEPKPVLLSSKTTRTDHFFRLCSFSSTVGFLRAFSAASDRRKVPRRVGSSGGSKTKNALGDDFFAVFASVFACFCIFLLEGEFWALAPGKLPARSPGKNPKIARSQHRAVKKRPVLRGLFEKTRPARHRENEPLDVRQQRTLGGFCILLPGFASSACGRRLLACFLGGQ